MKKLFFKAISIITMIVIILACSDENDNVSNTPQEKKSWTIMHYGACDDDTDEVALPYYNQMKSNFQENEDVNLILYTDRSPNYSDDIETFGENFSDTRLYQIKGGNMQRINGKEQFPEISETSNYEANSGDAINLKKFIQFCKANYPADNYALIIMGHGSNPHMCYDETSDNDPLFTSEITEVLTKEESVQLTVLDVCLMGGIENAYQFRNERNKFGTDFLVASAPESHTLPYGAILSRLRTNGSNSINPKTLTPINFGKLFIEENRKNLPNESWSLYDLSKVKVAKQKIDLFAEKLAEFNEKDDFESLRGSGANLNGIGYSLFLEPTDNYWIADPYFDIYDLAERVEKSSSFNIQIKNSATQVMEAVDNLIVESYMTELAFPEFKEGLNGISIFFPDGDAIVEAYPTLIHWNFQTWYSPNFIPFSPVFTIGQTIDHPDLGRYSYGKYAWCIDNATPNNNKVTNWFEMLDSWFDTSNTNSGGINSYKW